MLYHVILGSVDGCVRLWDVRKGGSAGRSYLMSFDAHQDDHLTANIDQDDAQSSRKRIRECNAEAANDIDFASRVRTEELYSRSSGQEQSQSGLSVPVGGVHARVRGRQQARAASQAIDWSREGAAVAHRDTEVVALKYSPSGAHLVTCGNDGQVRSTTCNVPSSH